MNYYEHHLGDYLRDTAHLTMLEDGAYRRLMDCYYVRESPLPSELREACRLVRAVTKQERDAVAAVLREFFIPGPDGWRHKRCDVEVARFQDKQRKAKASADARWSQSDRNANASADAMRTHSEGNATRERGRPRAPARPQTPDTRHQTPILHPEDADRAPAQDADANPPRKRNRTPDRPVDVSEQVWADWLSLRERKRAPVTSTVLASAIGEAGRAGMTLEAFLTVWCARGSQGLQADWIKPTERAGPAAPPPETPWQRSQRERVAEMSGGTVSRRAPAPDTEIIDVNPTIAAAAR